jgi:hypothetical protein
MSKKKNTLKDLNEFLKQQAATLVPPSRLQENLDAQTIQSEEHPSSQSVEHTTTRILEDLKRLSEAEEGSSFRQQLYDIIIHTLETQSPSLPEDKMLINTALYLKSGEHWKEAIRAYWRVKKD